MDASQILDTVIGSVIGTVCSAIYSFFKKIWEKRQKQSKKEENLKRYYEYVKKTLDEEKPALVGDGALSDEAVYIDAYSIGDGENEHGEKILDSIDQWSRNSKFGVMLIHGEPGHGKTTLCCKAVYEHHSKRFCKDKTNVFWFRLNPAFAEGIIENGKFVLKNAFCWGDPEIKLSRIPLEENEKQYQNSVVFLDGYDELKAHLHEINRNLTDFIDLAEQLARTYHMHIIITTRTRSLDDEFVSSSIKKLQFALMSEEQQNKWIEKNAPRYKEDFEVLRVSSKEMKEMLGIPILFRMVVQAQLRSTAAENVVGLYDELFKATMIRRKMKGGDIEGKHKEYEQLAYKIYCNDETFANMRDEELPEDFLYSFYLKGKGKKRIGFLHRSFYQYFLAHFLYRKMDEIKDEESAEAFLCCLAERQIDYDILDYIQQIQENKPDIIQEECEQIIDILEQTGTIIERASKAPNEKGTAEQNQLLRYKNILVNALSICCVVAATEQSEIDISLRDKKNIHQAMRKYNCEWIRLDDVDLSGADLSDMDLNRWHLVGANLNETNLTRAQLSLADLRGTKLVGTDLRGANLSGSDLSHADLRGANLSDVDLSCADLRWAIGLESCHIEDAKEWGGCRILNCDRAKLDIFEFDANYICWCDDETGDLIAP